MNAQVEPEMAIRLFQEALYVYDELYTALSKVAALVYENISAVKVEQGFLQDAIAASAEALKIRRRQQGDDHTDTKERMVAHRSLLKRLLENRTFCLLQSVLVLTFPSREHCNKSTRRPLLLSPNSRQTQFCALVIPPRVIVYPSIENTLHLEPRHDNLR